MTPSADVSIEQHAIEIRRNGEAWERKPRLREAYRGFYRMISSRIDTRIAGPVVELGSGLGRIREVIPACITTDLFPNPWLDRRENSYRLGFSDNAVSHLILFDVWHHLRYPGTALREFRRVLAPGGRVILFEPAVSWLGRIVYGRFHHEPVGLGEPITWSAPEGFTAEQADYFAAQGSATRIFWWGQGSGHLDGWKVCEVLPLASFRYLATGGFAGPQMGGAWIDPLLGGMDRLASLLPRVFAARLLVVLRKEEESA